MRPMKSLWPILPKASCTAVAQSPPRPALTDAKGGLLYRCLLEDLGVHHSPESIANEEAGKRADGPPADIKVVVNEGVCARILNRPAELPSNTASLGFPSPTWKAPYASLSAPN